MRSPAVRIYTAILLVLGLAMTIFGYALPLGGGVLVMLVGVAAVAAGLALVGVHIMLRDRMPADRTQDSRAEASEARRGIPEGSPS